MSAKETTVSTEADQLRASIAALIPDLETAPCTFWACPGPDVPAVDMITCRVCAALIGLRELAASEIDPATRGVGARREATGYVLAQLDGDRQVGIAGQTWTTEVCASADVAGGVHREKDSLEWAAYERHRVGGTCRVCGCTDDDCTACIAATGIPCSWVEPDLCSRCAEDGRHG